MFADDSICISPVYGEYMFICIYSCTVQLDSSECISKLLCNEIYLHYSIWLLDIMVYYDMFLLKFSAFAVFLR